MAPSGSMLGCPIRPPCMSWAKITPPASCTASVTGRQAATWASAVEPGRGRVAVPEGLGEIPSLMMSPALARCA